MLGRQVEVEGDGDENVPLYYDIIDNFRIQFGREEFCLITGLRFGDLDLADYNDREMPIPFRRRVFPSCYDGEHITGSTILEIIEDDVFVRIHNQDVVSLCCLGILQLGNMPAKRLTPDETEARAKWWISSRAYFDGEFLERMNVEPVREANTGPIFANQHFGINDLSEPRSMQSGPSSFQTHPNSSSFFNIGTPTNWQTPMQSQPGPSNWHSQMPAQPGPFNIGTPTNWQTPMLSIT
ncbi:hypothetical protein Tco_0928460 [Tanacetum coccineum]